MSIGNIAALIAATAAVVLVALLAVPIVKLGHVMDEITSSVRDVDRSALEILEELRQTVITTNEEISRIGDVTENVNRMSEHAANATQHASDVGRVVATVVGAPARATSRMRTAMHRHRRPKAVAAIEAPTRHQTAQDAHEAASRRGEPQSPPRGRTDQAWDRAGPHHCGAPCHRRVLTRGQRRRTAQILHTVFRPG